MLISSKDNANIKSLVKLISSKKERAEKGEFVVEGMRNCIDMVMAYENDEVEISALFYTAKALEKYKELLPTDCFNTVPQNISFEITEELSQRISQGEGSQGVFVIVKKLDKILNCDTIDLNGKYVILDNIQDPGNLGTILRTADAMGASGVVLCNNCCDLYNPKVVRSAMGSLSRVSVYVENSFENAIDVFKKCSVPVVASVINGGEDISSFDFPKSCAVVIGNEGRGMPKEHVKLCDKSVTIAMKGNINSLNAATAATIIMWEMFR